MNVFKKHSSVFILAVFLTAQLGEPLHYLWVNHTNLWLKAKENTFKPQVIVHTCSHFHFVKNRYFLLAGSSVPGAHKVVAGHTFLSFFYEQYFTKQVNASRSVRGPPQIV